MKKEYLERIETILFVSCIVLNIISLQSAAGLAATLAYICCWKRIRIERQAGASAIFRKGLVKLCKTWEAHQYADKLATAHAMAHWPYTPTSIEVMETVDSLQKSAWQYGNGATGAFGVEGNDLHVNMHVYAELMKLLQEKVPVSS